MDYPDDSPSPVNDERENIAKNIVLDEIKNVQSNARIIKQNECSACHILFKLAEKMQINESHASDMLSEILSQDAELNNLFIEMVENIHMKQRMMAVPFSIKSRVAKDKYIDSTFRNTLSELSSDLINYGSDIVLRKLVIFNRARDCTKYWYRLPRSNRRALLLYAKE